MRHFSNRKRLLLGTVLPARGVCGAMVVLAAGSAYGQGPSTDDFVKQALSARPQGRVSVIVKSDTRLSARDEAKLGHIGAYVYRHLDVVSSTAVNVPAKNLARLLALPYVRHVSMDSTIRKTDAFTVGASGASTAWTSYGANGAGVGVAVLDSGIRNGADFGSRVRASVNLSGEPGGTEDKCGHGTHVAGIIAGSGANSTGPKYFQTFTGVAPSANLVDVRVLDSTGSGDVSNVIAGVQWVVNHKAQYGIRVLNISMGHPVGESYKTDPLCQAVEAAWKAGIVVVCSAGNAGRASATKTQGASNEGYGTAYGSIQSPGNDPYVITVGAMKDGGGARSDDQVATYSSRGPSRFDFVVKPDIMAPGNQVVSVLAKNGYLDKNYSATNSVMTSEYYSGHKDKESKDYFRLSGTSMAAPVVSAAAAMLLQLNPNLSPDTVKARLMLSADKWWAHNGKGDLFTYGAGYLNIPAALQSTVTTSQYAVSPTAYPSANGNVVVFMDPAVWGTGVTDLRAIWGERAIWGNDTGPTPDPEPTARAIWGTDDPLPDPTSRAIWGTVDPDPNDPLARAIWGTDEGSTPDPIARAIWGTDQITPDPQSRAIWGTAVWVNQTKNSYGQAGADISNVAIGGE